MVGDGGGWWRMMGDGGGWWRMVEEGGGRNQLKILCLHRIIYLPRVGSKDWSRAKAKDSLVAFNNQLISLLIKQVCM